MEQVAQAVVFDGPDQPFRTVTLPWPALGPGDVLVEIACSTLCGSDLHTWQGRRTTPLPTVLGHEICGRIAALGAPPPTAVDGGELRVGDRVTWSLACSCGACFYCRADLPQKCEQLRKYGHEAITPGFELFGGLATHCRVAAGTALVKLPEHVPDDLAAVANCAVATVRAALDEVGGSRTALVHGAGMLGLVAVAMLADHGVRSYVVEPDPRRQALAVQLGAVGVAEQGEALCPAIASATAGRGVDVALDFSGHPPALTEGLSRLRLGGRAVWVGSVFPAGELALEPERLVRRNLSIRGVHNYAPHHLAAAVDWLATTPRLPVLSRLVERRFPLSEVAEAFAVAVAERPVRVAVLPEGKSS